MANMLDAYNGPKSDSQHEDGWPGEEQVKDSKKKNPQAKQSAKATGKRTRASQRNAGALCPIQGFQVPGIWLGPSFLRKGFQDA